MNSKTQLGAKADVFGGVSRHGRSVILDEDDVQDRTKRGLMTHTSQLLGVSAIEGGRIDLDRGSQIQVADHGALKRYLIQKGDIILPCRSTRIRVVVVPVETAGFPIDSTLIAIRPHDDLDPFVLAAYLEHPKGQASILQASASGTTQMNITVTALQSLFISVPGRKKQKQLSELVQAATCARDTAIEAAIKRFDVAMEITINVMTAGESQNG